jgi:hypothetical protein
MTDPISHLLELAAEHRRMADQFEAAAARLFAAELQPLVAATWEAAAESARCTSRDLTNRTGK